MDPCFYCGSSRSKRARSKLRGKTIATCTNNAQCERRCGLIIKRADEKYGRRTGA